MWGFMKRIGYLSGLVLLVLGTAVLLAELFTGVQGSRSVLSIGAIWFRLHANSLVGFQAAIEKSLSPDLWPPIQTLITIPAWFILMPLGLALVFSCRRRAHN